MKLKLILICILTTIYDDDKVKVRLDVFIIKDWVAYVNTATNGLRPLRKGGPSLICMWSLLITILV